MSTALFYLSEYQKQDYMGWGYSGFLLKASPVRYQVPELASNQHQLHNQLFGQNRLAVTAKQTQRWSAGEGDQLAVDCYEIEEPIDGWGGDVAGADRCAELKGLALTLTLIALLDTKENFIVTDAKMVLGGMKKILSTGGQINLTPNGQPVAHHGLWQEILGLTLKILGKGQKLTVEALKARAGVKAFETACNNAARGWVMAYNKVDNPEMTYNPFSNEEIKPSSLQAASHLLQKQWYFIPQAQSKLGDRSLYFMGDHGKDKDQFGKSRAESYLSVVALTQPDPFFEKIRAHFDTKGEGSDHIYIVNAKKLTEAPLRQELYQHGLNYCYWQTKEECFRLYDDSLVVSKLHPVLKGYKAFMALNALVALLQELLSGEGRHLLRVDITAQVLTPKPKNKWGVDVNLLSGERCIRLTLPEIPQPIVLTLDLDLPGSGLQRLAKEQPKIELVWIKETRTTGRYFVFISTGEGVSLWSAYESNLRFLKEDIQKDEVLSPQTL